MLITSRFLKLPFNSDDIILVSRSLSRIAINLLYIFVSENGFRKHSILSIILINLYAGIIPG